MYLLFWVLGEGSSFQGQPLGAPATFSIMADLEDIFHLRGHLEKEEQTDNLCKVHSVKQQR